MLLMLVVTAEGLQASGNVDKSIAVLPFVNRSGSHENTRFFPAGFHADLLTALANIPELRVTAHHSVMSYRDTTKNRQEIGAELGVNRLLEGSVQLTTGRVTIQVQLSNALTGETLCAETLDRKTSMENIFGIRGEIIAAVARELSVPLTAMELDSHGQAPTKNLESYQSALAAVQIAHRGNPVSIDRAVEYARKAVMLDPNYPHAYLALAFSLTQGIENGAISAAEAGAEIASAIETAMRLKPDDDRAWFVQGHYQAVTGQQNADESFGKAVQLNPGSAENLYASGDILLSVGRPQEALPLLVEASKLDPLAKEVLIALGRTYDVLEAYEDARAIYAKIRAIDPMDPLGYTPNSASYVAEGRLDDALYWLNLAQVRSPKDIELGARMVFLNDCLEDYETAQEWSSWLDSRITRQPHPMAMQARHHYLSGNFGVALQYSNLAIRLGLDNHLNSDSVFMRIKRDEALANGQPEAGIGVFRSRHPLLLAARPEIRPDNMLQAVDLSLLLVLAGREQEARNLLHAVITAYETPWFITGSERSWLVPAKAQALAILGDGQGALMELRRIIDKGWRVYWRWETDLNANFNGIRQTAEFRAMVAGLEADMTAQRERTQAMAESGKIVPPPAAGIR
jgi:TolB-like protein/Tfp pilus assembly protein PilF